MSGEQASAVPVVPVAVRMEDVPRYLGCGRTRAWELVRQGRLRVVRHGRAVTVPYADLVAFVEEQADAWEPGRQGLEPVP